MELRYGKVESYKHNLNKEQLNWLTEQTNRSNAQTLFLFQLVDGDFEKLKQLEIKIKNHHYCPCPNTKKEVEEILKWESKSNWFTLKNN